MSGSSLAVVDQPIDDTPSAAPTPAPTRHYVDPDDLEREAALRDVDAERNAAPAPAPAAADPAPAAPPPGGDTIMVPKARLDEALRRAQAAETALAYSEGQRAVLQQTGPAAPAAPDVATPPAEPPEYAEARAIEAEWNQAWTDFDTGAITGTELGQKMVQSISRIVALNMERTLAQAQAMTMQMVQNLPPAVGVVDQQVMAQHVARLEAEHPWSRHLNEREAAALMQMAHTEAQALGRSYPKGPTGTMALQQRVAELATIYMPQWHANEEPPAAPAPGQPGRAPAPANATQPAPRQAPNGPTRADVEEAMRRQAALPPNSPGSHGPNSGPVTLERVNTMTDDELAQLPQSERRRLLGIQT